MLESAARLDTRFKVVTSDAPLGLPKALNLLCERLHTPFFARMDGDDVAAPERLERQLAAALENPRIDLFGSLVSPLGDSTPGWLEYLQWLNSVQTEDEIAANAYTDNVLPHPTWFGPSATLKNAGGYREGDFPEDYDLFLRLRLSGARFAKVSQPLLAWRDHPQRLTRTNPRYGADATLKMKAAHLAEELSANPLWRGRMIWIRGAGKTGRVLAAELLRRGVTPGGFSDPLKAGSTVMGLPVATPQSVEHSGNLTLLAARPRHLRKALCAELEGKGLKLGEDYLVMT